MPKAQPNKAATRHERSASGRIQVLRIHDVPEPHMHIRTDPNPGAVEVPPPRQPVVLDGSDASSQELSRRRRSSAGDSVPSHYDVQLNHHAFDGSPLMPLKEVSVLHDVSPTLPPTSAGDSNAPSEFKSSALPPHPLDAYTAQQAVKEYAYGGDALRHPTDGPRRDEGGSGLPFIRAKLSTSTFTKTTRQVMYVKPQETCDVLSLTQLMDLADGSHRVGTTREEEMALLQPAQFAQSVGTVADQHPRLLHRDTRDGQLTTVPNGCLLHDGRRWVRPGKMPSSSTLSPAGVESREGEGACASHAVVPCSAQQVVSAEDGDAPGEYLVQRHTQTVVTGELAKDTSYCPPARVAEGRQAMGPSSTEEADRLYHDAVVDGLHRRNVERRGAHPVNPPAASPPQRIIYNINDNDRPQPIDVVAPRRQSANGPTQQLEPRRPENNSSSSQTVDLSAHPSSASLRSSTLRLRSRAEPHNGFADGPRPEGRTNGRFAYLNNFTFEAQLTKQGV